MDAYVIKITQLGRLMDIGELVSSDFVNKLRNYQESGYFEQEAFFAVMRIDPSQKKGP